jgi:CobQ-like glutamine amidotransferase family enzyme
VVGAAVCTRDRHGPTLPKNPRLVHLFVACACGLPQIQAEDTVGRG